MNRKHQKYTEVLDEFLKDENFAASFLSQALEEDFSVFLLSLKDVMRVHGSITSIAKKAKVSRATLYKALGDKSNPELKTILTILHAMGYDFQVIKRSTTASK